jgi:hypothetical protein
LPDDRKRSKHKKTKKGGKGPGLADMWDAEVTTP